MNSKEFMQWFEQHVKTRWQGLDLTWIEIGDWHWRLEKFDADILTRAVRRHKVCEDWRVPSLKKVYEHACKIQANNHPKPKRDDTTNGIPDEHTFIMCVAKSANGGGCVGHFVPILIWPFHKTYTPETYRRIAEEQCVMHSRNGRNGIWKPFYNTTRTEILTRRWNLLGVKPLDMDEMRKRYKHAPNRQ
ncbi:MAG: hypothetical protein ACYTEN_06710 [Planctomycetota bacterium]|jgi:hypothetical protein